MGLTVSDAIRLLLLRVAEEKRLPFEVKVPNARTIEAMQEAREISRFRFETAQASFDELEKGS